MKNTKTSYVKATLFDHFRHTKNKVHTHSAHIGTVGPMVCVSVCILAHEADSTVIRVRTALARHCKTWLQLGSQKKSTAFDGLMCYSAILLLKHPHKSIRTAIAQMAQNLSQSHENMLHEFCVGRGTGWVRSPGCLLILHVGYRFHWHYSNVVLAFFILARMWSFVAYWGKINGAVRRCAHKANTEQLTRETNCDKTKRATHATFETSIVFSIAIFHTCNHP